MHIWYLEGFHDSIYHEQFQSLPQSPTSPPPCLAMSLLPCGERLAGQTARCGATITSSCWEWDLTCKTTTHTTRSLEHRDATYTKLQASATYVLHARWGHTNPKSIVQSQEHAQKDIQSLNKTFILSWEAGFLFHWYVLKYTHNTDTCQSSGNKDRKTGNRDILPKHTKEQPTKLWYY